MLNLIKLKAYGSKTLNCRGEIVSIDRERLHGGNSPAELERITLTFEACPHTLEFVQKRTYPSEVQVMLALAELPDAPSLSEVIDHAWAPSSGALSNNWFITPFYDGTPLTFKDEVPEDIICTLARVHHTFQTQIERFNHLFCVDSTFFARTLTQAVNSLEVATGETSNPTFAKGLEQLRKTQKNEQLFQMLDSLPVTLTHGDMHPTNMVRLPEGRTVLLDLGNVRLAPHMLDLANLIPMGSKSWKLYLKAWEDFTGEPMELRIAHLGYHWATIMVNTMYMPHAIRHATPEHVGKMLWKAAEAEREIKELFL